MGVGPEGLSWCRRVSHPEGVRHSEYYASPHNCTQPRSCLCSPWTPAPISHFPTAKQSVVAADSELRRHTNHGPECEELLTLLTIALFYRAGRSCCAPLETLTLALPLRRVYPLAEPCSQLLISRVLSLCVSCACCVCAKHVLSLFVCMCV